MRKKSKKQEKAVQSVGQAVTAVPFVRLSNLHIRHTQAPVAVSDHGFSSLSALGLYALLSALLSNPAFETASGGMQKLLSAHCKNGVFSLTGTLRALRRDGYLRRTRIPVGTNRFSDYYDLSETKQKTDTAAVDTAVIGVRNLTVKEANAYLRARTPFVPPVDDFTKVSVPMLLDPRLSLAAKGLYTVIARYLRLSSYKEDIVLSKAFLSSVLPIGENAFDRLFRELRKTGYLTLTRARDPLTGYGFYRYALNEVADDTATAISAAPRMPAAESVPPTDSDTAQAPIPAKSAPTPVTPDDIRARIDYDCLLSDYPRDRLDAVVSILSAFSTGKSPHLPPGLHAASADVASRLSALDSEDIRFVLDTYAEVSKSVHIRNIRAYLTTCLYHAKENLALALDRISLQTPGLVRS